jgi:hypothetical protein
VAVLAVVAVAIAAAAGITASGIGGSVLQGMQRGLCAVAPGPCPTLVVVRDDLAPCPVRRESRKERLGETIAVVELGSSGTLSAVRRSDGTVTVTLADGSDVGAVFKLGGKVAIGRAVGALRRAGVGVAWSSGSSWELPSEAAAQDFVARFGDKATIKGKLVDEVRSRCSLLCDALGWRPHEQLPEPDATFEEGGPTAKLEAAFGLGERGAEGTAHVGGLLGRRVARDGSTRWYVALSGNAAGQLKLPASGVDGIAGGEAVVSYELDRDGRPRSLAISVAGEAGGRAGARGVVRSGGAVRSGAGGLAERLGGMVELEATLDLTDPANLAAAADLLDTLRRPGDYGRLPARVGALGTRIADDGQIDVRAYRQRTTSSEYGAALALGVALDGSFERSTSGLDLVAAFTRLPGLPFLVRDDCRAT